MSSSVFSLNFRKASKFFLGYFKLLCFAFSSFTLKMWKMWFIEWQHAYYSIFIDKISFPPFFPILMITYEFTFCKTFMWYLLTAFATTFIFCLMPHGNNHKFSYLSKLILHFQCQIQFKNYSGIALIHFSPCKFSKFLVCLATCGRFAPDTFNCYNTVVKSIYTPTAFWFYLTVYSVVPFSSFCSPKVFFAFNILYYNLWYFISVDKFSFIEFIKHIICCPKIFTQHMAWQRYLKRKNGKKKVPICSK